MNDKQVSPVAREDHIPPSQDFHDNAPVSDLLAIEGWINEGDPLLGFINDE